MPGVHGGGGSDKAKVMKRRRWILVIAFAEQPGRKSPRFELLLSGMPGKKLPVLPGADGLLAGKHRIILQVFGDCQLSYRRALDRVHCRPLTIKVGPHRNDRALGMSGALRRELRQVSIGISAGHAALCLSASWSLSEGGGQWVYG